MTGIRGTGGAAARRPASSLPDDACPACGTTVRERQGKLCLPVNGEEIAVPGSPHLECPRCGEVVLRLDDARRLREQALEIYRRKHGLLSASEIKSIRVRLGLTQGALARLLCLGPNTISRWESGRNAQTAAMDVLLHLIRDLPENLDYLRSRAASHRRYRPRRQRHQRRAS